MGAEDNLIRDFEKETHTLLDAEQRIKREYREKRARIIKNIAALDFYVNL